MRDLGWGQVRRAEELVDVVNAAAAAKYASEKAFHQDLAEMHKKTRPPAASNCSAELDALVAKNAPAKPLLGQTLVALNLPKDNENDRTAARPRHPVAPANSTIRMDRADPESKRR